MPGEWVSIEALPLPPLGSDEVQIWRVDLPLPETPPERYFHLLADDEKKRADRLRMGQVRLQFVVARASLRALLGAALGTESKLVPITPNSFGKPGTPGIFYNVAHSGATILIALCRNHSVGVDVESVSRRVDAIEIAKSSFAANEYRALASIDDKANLRQAFFRCWTRKEAVIKADGRGLSLALNSFAVPVLEAANDAPVILPASDAFTANCLYVSDLALVDGVAAAYAIAVPHLALRMFLLNSKQCLRASGQVIADRSLTPLRD